MRKIKKARPMRPRHRSFFYICLFIFVTGMASYSTMALASADKSTTPEFAAPGKSVVTSLGKCFAQLDAADAIDIRTNYLKPWAECQKRLEAKKRKEQTAKAGEKSEDTTKTTPETPRNYVRVQKTPLHKKGTAKTAPVDDKSEK